MNLFFKLKFNPILHTWWLDNHALTLINFTAKYYFGEKSKFLHTFRTLCPESRKIKSKLIKFLFDIESGSGLTNRTNTDPDPQPWNSNSKLFRNGKN